MKAGWVALFKVFVCITYLISLIAIQPSYAQLAEDNIINEKSVELSDDDLQRISGELKYIDEVLTSSVLSYIFSGDEKWLVRYQKNEPKLTNLIEQLLNRKSIEDLTLISSIEKTNQQLVAIEIEAIALAQNQQRQSAMALINGDHYHLLKADYMSMLSAFIENISHRSLYKKSINEDETDLVLSLEEANWAANNKIKVGVELWPPILSIKNGQLSGLTGDVINRIANKAGLEVEIVVGTWHEIFSKFKAGEIDVIPNSYMQENRKEYGQFSKPYFLVRELFFVKDDNRSFHANADLTNATVAIPEGYTTIDKVNELFPAINVVKTPNLETSIQLVLTGKVDALLDSKVAVNDYVKNNNISGLREIDEDVIYPNSLHILTSNKHPILHSIMVKGLDSLKMSDVVMSQSKWITQEEPLKIKQQNDTKNMLWLSLGALVTLLIIGSIISSLVLKANDRELANKFSSSLFRRSILGGLLILSNVLILTAFLVTKHAENQTNQSLQYNLNTLLTTTHQRLMQWSRYELNHLHSLSKDKQLVELVEELLLLPNNKQALTSSPIQTQIRKHIRYKEGENQGKGFFIISLDNLSLSSRRDENIGSENLIYQHYPALLNQVKKGELVFIPPIPSDVKLRDEDHDAADSPTMFFSVPIVNNRNRVIAILAKRIDFDGPFSSILSAGFIGKSGETYAINKSGILLSNVRFENDLKKIGLIHPQQRASLNLRIANPGENLIEKGTLTKAAASWPLTYMANQIALEKSGENLEGYNDYRGVTVVGSWLWDETINMGLVAEVDAEESFALLTTFKNTIWTVMFITLLLLFGSTLFTLRVGTRATKTLARSHAQLEKIVDERTQALQTNMERTQSIIDNASDGIVVVDDNGKIIEFSPASEAIFGYRASEALEMNVYQLMNTPFHHKYIENKNKEETKLIELIGVCHDQSLIDIEVAVSETHNDGNVFYTGFIRNTTMRKEAERELKKAKAKAEEATQAKSDFLANMSHEIRTPMNAIIGMSYLALQTELSTKQEDYVNKIHSSAEALLGIINDILDFSKIEAGKMSIEYIPFDLNETIDHLVQITSHKSQEKELELLIDIDPQLPINLIGDPLRLGQILINLTNNAVKFTEQGEIIVRAKLKERHDSGDVLIEFAVEDSGIGMTEAQVDGLFQSFSQADASTTRKYGGTGLGLTISKTLTQMMGGKIWVESKYGHGSTFFFTAVFPVSQITSSKILATPESLEHLPILIVDDSKASRQILSTLATSLKYKPEVASSGQEALGMLITAEQNDTPFSLVLADWKMPEMDGIELGKTIESNDEIVRKPKYMLVTAYDRDDMLEEANGLHIDGSLTKPVNASTLLDSIMTVMGSNAFHKQRKSIAPVNDNLTYGLAGAHLLLVEDNEINQQIAVELLNMAKINVETAWNGKEAIEKINQNTYDAVLMDVQMPVMDGYTATELLRENPNHADLIIIAMTANAMEGDRDKCLEVGMNDHLPKPIDPKQVFSVLSKWIKGKKNHADDALLPTSENEQPISDEELSFDLPGFDVSNAIMRMAGNKKLYQRTLERVAESQKDALIKTNQALSENNLKQAIIAIHTLRGVAANIGANFILENAEELEILLCNVEDKGQPYDELQVKKLLEQCSSQHHQMIETINHWLVKSKTVNQPKAKPKEAISEDVLRQSLLAIHEKLDSFDSSAIDDLEHIMSMAVPNDINNELNNIYDVVSQYDFDTASEQLNLLITKIS